MNVKMIVTDLDGTLLRSDKTISERTLRAFEKCRAYGIVIGAATARSEYSARKYLGLLKPDFIISNGGGLASIGGEIVYKSMLDSAAVSGIIKRCREVQPDGEITVDTDEGYYWNYKEKPSADSDYGNAVYCDFSDFNCPAYKITAELEREADMHKIAEEFPVCGCLSFIGETWRRFANKKADKISALKIIAERLCISADNIAAYDDDLNDIEMLEYCGIGIAMGNASEAVKRAAGYVCCTNDNDGIAKFTENVLLR